MPSPELDRLVAINLLQHEAPIREEFDGLVREAALTLADAKREDLSPESRFRLAATTTVPPSWRRKPIRTSCMI